MEAMRDPSSLFAILDNEITSLSLRRLLTLRWDPGAKLSFLPSAADTNIEAFLLWKAGVLPEPIY
jgi:hypothetical protein